MATVDYWEMPTVLVFAAFFLSMCAYLLDLLIIFKSGSFRFYAVKLFFCLAVSQLCFIMPQLIIPFFVDIGQPNSYPCKFQAYMINSSWMSASINTIYISMAIWRILNGKIITEYNICFWQLFVLVFVLAVNLPFYFLAHLDTYGITYNGNVTKYFCNQAFDGSGWFYGMLSLNTLLLLVNLGYSGVIIWKRKKLKKMGIEIHNPMLYLFYFPVIDTILWNVNLLFKLSDIQDWFRPQGSATSVIWVLLNILICCEGLVTSSLFYFSFEPLIMKQLPPCLKRTVKIFRCVNLFTICFSKPKVNAHQIQKSKNQVEETCIFEDSEQDLDSQMINSSVAK